MSSKVCEFCSKNYSNIYTLQTHLKKCKEKMIFLYNELQQDITKVKQEKDDLKKDITILQNEKNELASIVKSLETDKSLLLSTIQQQNEKIISLEDEQTNLKKQIFDLQLKNKEYEIAQKYICESKNEYKEMIGKVSTTINSYSNNQTSSNNNITLKQIVSKLEPISYDDIKKSMSLFSNEYIDDGIIGFARFLCDHSCNNKIITSDKSRNTIAYRTKFNDFIKDPECLYLINKTLQDNSDEIISKTEERREYYKELFDVDDEFETYVKRGSRIQELKRLTQSSLSEKPDDNIKKIAQVLTNHGVKTYQKTVEQIKCL
jgi:predicted nuclease with TOPRIM domain